MISPCGAHSGAGVTVGLRGFTLPPPAGGPAYFCLNPPRAAAENALLQREGFGDAFKTLRGGEGGVA